MAELRKFKLADFFLFFIFLSGTRRFPRTEAKLNVQSHTTQPGASFDCSCGGSVYRIEIPSCRTLSDTRGAPAKSNLSGTLGFPIVQTTNWSVSWEMIPYNSPYLAAPTPRGLVVREKNANVDIPKIVISLNRKVFAVSVFSTVCLFVWFCFLLCCCCDCILLLLLFFDKKSPIHLRLTYFIVEVGAR